MAMMLGGRSVSSEINVTPMIDVLLVLLIIFMVVFPYQSVGERAEIPLQDKEAIQPPFQPIVIQLKEASVGHRPVLKINEEEIAWENLEARLQKIYSVRIDKVAFVKGDPEIDFQYVAEAIDVTHHAGVTHVGLLGGIP